MSIPSIVPLIQAAQVLPDMKEPTSRAELIESLPAFLEVVLTSPEGLSLINVGEDIPDAADRNKPWFSKRPTNDEEYPLGVYVFNIESDEWENIAPSEIAEIMEQLQAAKEVAEKARTTAQEAAAEADRSKQYSTDSTTHASDAEIAALDTATMMKIAMTNAAGVWFGHNVGYDPDWTVLPAGGVREFYTNWKNFPGVPNLKSSPLPVATLTITKITVLGDVPPAQQATQASLPLMIGAQVRVDPATNKLQGRVVGYVTVPCDYDRQIEWMWLVKGELVEATPDIAVTDITLDNTTPIIGQRVTATITIKNIGADCLYPFRVGWWAHRDSEPSNEVGQDGERLFGALAAGETRIMQRTFLAGGELGLKKFWVMADTLNQITTETEKGNNKAYKEYTITNL